MEIDIYATNKPTVFIAVQATTQVPEQVVRDYGVKTKPWKTRDISDGKKWTALKSDEVVADIQRQGYAVLCAAVITTEIV